MTSMLQVVSNIDLGIYRWFSGFAGNWTLDRLASQEEADNLFKGGLFLATYCFLWFRGGPRQERQRAQIVAIVVGALLALIVGRTISVAIPFRVRPIYDPTLLHPQFTIPVRANLENWSSFPSDSATFFCALAFGVGYLARRWAIPVAAYCVTWICLPRLYLGLHYASDIVAGAVIGMLMVWVLVRMEWLQSAITPHILAIEETKPQWFYGIAFIVCFEIADVFTDMRNVGHVVFRGIRSQLEHGIKRSEAEFLWELIICTALAVTVITLLVLSRLRDQREHDGGYRFQLARKQSFTRPPNPRDLRPSADFQSPF